MGFKVVVYTTRNNAMACHNKDHNTLELSALVQNQLEKGGIPYDFIALFKPLARYYIDDRAIRFASWRQALAAIQSYETTAAANKIEDMQSRIHNFVVKLND
jgi:hypothetical protein